CAQRSKFHDEPGASAEPILHLYPILGHAPDHDAECTEERTDEQNERDDTHEQPFQRSTPAAPRRRAVAGVRDVWRRTLGRDTHFRSIRKRPGTWGLGLESVQMRNCALFGPNPRPRAHAPIVTSTPRRIDPADTRPRFAVGSACRCELRARRARRTPRRATSRSRLGARAPSAPGNRIAAPGAGFRGKIG